MATFPPSLFPAIVIAIRERLSLSSPPLLSFPFSLPAATTEEKRRRDDVLALLSPSFSFFLSHDQQEG